MHAVFVRGSNKTYKMKIIIEILLSITCVYAIFIQLLRIIWLYFPSFIRGRSMYKIKDPGRTEMLLYFILAIVAMAYFIFIKMQNILQPGVFTATM